MLNWIKWNCSQSAGCRLIYLCLVGITILAGCSTTAKSWTDTLTDPASAGINRRNQGREAAGLEETRPPTSTQPSKSAADSKANQEPYRLNPMNIIKMVYEANPWVQADREEMIAAQYALEEFKANLSRFEPFTRIDADMSKFPKRRDSEGITGEVVGGIEKETFEGAVIRVEGGASGSRFEFGEVDEGQERVEEGSGGLVRARFEVPFVGSRKRQDRIISQAYQESRARNAELDYLDHYRKYVDTAVYYYHYTIVYLNYVRAYEKQLSALKELLNNPRCKEEDKNRIEGTIGSTQVLRDQYERYYHDYLIDLLSRVGLDPKDNYILEELPYKESKYLELTSTPEGIETLTEQAYKNNPTFRVLRNAIKDSQVQLDQAIKGKLDVTAFVEGTQFAFGSETYDDRVGGWEVGGGLRVRLNDQRVLKATKLKAEAQIRQYRAKIKAEKIDIRNDIITESNALRTSHKTRKQMIKNIAKREAEFQERLKRYLEGGNGDGITIDDVIYALSNISSDKTKLAVYDYQVRDAEMDLMSATGEFYQMVGMDVGNGDELELPQK